MKRIAKVLSLVGSASCLFACGNASATSSSAEEAPKISIVAEGTSFVSHGYDMNLLYQEYSDGNVSVWQTNYMDGYEPLGLKYECVVTKGVDEDNDPYVNLKINKCYMYGKNTESGELEKTDATENWTTGEDCETSSYDTTTGIYSLPFTFSLFGYTNKTATIEVKPTSNPTDHLAWETTIAGMSYQVFID